MCIGRRGIRDGNQVVRVTRCSLTAPARQVVPRQFGADGLRSWGGPIYRQLPAKPAPVPGNRLGLRRGAIEPGLGSNGIDTERIAPWPGPGHRLCRQAIERLRNRLQVEPCPTSQDEPLRCHFRMSRSKTNLGISHLKTSESTRIGKPMPMAISAIRSACMPAINPK